MELCHTIGYISAYAVFLALACQLFQQHMQKFVMFKNQLKTEEKFRTTSEHSAWSESGGALSQGNRKKFEGAVISSEDVQLNNTICAIFHTYWVNVPVGTVCNKIMLLYTTFQNHVCCPATIFILNNTAYSDWYTLWQIYTPTTDRSYYTRTCSPAAEPGDWPDGDVCSSTVAVQHHCCDHHNSRYKPANLQPFM